MSPLPPATYRDRLIDRACRRLGIGQPTAEQRDLIEEVWAHPLMAGGRGAGKTTVLRILARMDRLREEDHRP